MIAMMTAAMQANKNAFMMTASHFSAITFAFIRFLFLTGLTANRQHGRQTCYPHYRQHREHVFSLTEYYGRAYGPDCS